MMHSVFLSLVLLIGAVRSAPPVEDGQNLQFAQASSDFAMDLLKELSRNNSENVLVAPNSVSVLLALLQQGAGGTTAEQLKNVLHLNPEDSKIGYANIIQTLQTEKTNLTIEAANRIYLKPESSVNEDFKKTAIENFDAGLETINFTDPDAASKINSWISQATHDQIKNLVDQSLLTSYTEMVLVNAIYFKGLWRHPFERKDTFESDFRLDESSTVNVSYLKQTKNFLGGENLNLGLKWVQLPFKDKGFSMIFILPTEDRKLNELIERLSGSDLLHLINTKERRNVRVLIPRFNLSKKSNLEEVLKKIGLVDIFTPSADLQGISADTKLQVSKVIHQTNVEIDEDGATAAAATYDIVHTLSLEYFPNELPFFADQPFLFFIVDRINKIPLFVGKINNPTT